MDERGAAPLQEGAVHALVVVRAGEHEDLGVHGGVQALHGAGVAHLGEIPGVGVVQGAERELVKVTLQ